MPGFKKDYMTMPDSKGNQWARTGGLFGRNRATSNPTKAKQAPAANANPYQQAVNPMTMSVGLNIKSKMLQNPFASKTAAEASPGHPLGDSAVSPQTTFLGGSLGFLGSTLLPGTGRALGENVDQMVNYGARAHKALRNDQGGVNPARVRSFVERTFGGASGPVSSSRALSNITDTLGRSSAMLGDASKPLLHHRAADAYSNVLNTRGVRHGKKILDLLKGNSRMKGLRAILGPLLGTGLGAGAGLAGGLYADNSGYRLDNLTGMPFKKTSNSAESGPGSMNANPIQMPPPPPMPPGAPPAGAAPPAPAGMYPAGQGPVTSQVQPQGQMGPMQGSPTTPQPMQADQMGTFPPMQVQASVGRYMENVHDHDLNDLFRGSVAHSRNSDLSADVAGQPNQGPSGVHSKAASGGREEVSARARPNANARAAVGSQPEKRGSVVRADQIGDLHQKFAILKAGIAASVDQMRGRAR